VAGNGQFIRSDNESILADMPDVAIHPATSEVGEFLPQYIKTKMKTPVVLTSSAGDTAK